MKKAFIGITGASGTIYAKRLIEVLSPLGFHISLSATKNAVSNASTEDGVNYQSIDEYIKHNALKVDKVYNIDNLEAAVASGSYKVDYTFIVPASMGYVARAATGISSNLIERVTDIAFKERRKIAVLFRELPLSKIHLVNLLKLADAGAFIVPLAPAFYHKPESINDLLDFVIGKTLDLFEIENNLYKRWHDK